MKKLVAVLMCLMMIPSVVSCEKNENPDTLSQNENTISDSVESDDTNTEPIQTSKPGKAMEMYEAAINDEICVFDERLGEAKLKSLRLPGNDINLDDCKLLTKAILDIDQDGVSEYVIKSPDNDCIILHYNDEKVYSHRLDSDDFYNFNTDGTFYWYDSSEAGEWECGLNRIVFDGETVNVKSIYSLKFSPNPTKYEYFVEGKSVTENEYYDYRNNNLHKKSMKFSQFELTCSYPVTAEQAWNLANAYWDNQDGSMDGAAGTTFTSRIVLIDTPNPETDYYRFAFQVESTSNGGGEGDECKPPYQVNSYDQILVNASTGEIIASTYEQGGKGVSVEEAIEIAKNDCEDIDFDNEGNVYRVEHAVNESAPDHVYVIVIQKYVVDHYSAYTKKWVDKNTGEIIFPYYMNGK